MAELEFSNLNPYQNIDFLEANSPQELLSLIKGHKGSLKILAMYSQGSRHIAWVMTGLQKIKKGK